MGRWLLSSAAWLAFLITTQPVSAAQAPPTAADAWARAHALTAANAAAAQGIAVSLSHDASGWSLTPSTDDAPHALRIASWPTAAAVLHHPPLLVTRQAVVWTPPHETAQPSPAAQRLAAIVAASFDADCCQAQTHVGAAGKANGNAHNNDPHPTLTLGRYHAIVRPKADALEDVARYWPGVAEGRVLVVIDPQTDKATLHTPAAIDRSRRRAPQPGEQRLGPNVDLSLEKQTLEAGVAQVFAEALGRLHEAGELSQPARQATLDAALPQLMAVVMAYAGHTGPATAAGHQYYEKTARQLEQAVMRDRLPTCDTRDWAQGVLSVAPGLWDQLSRLPAATVENLDELLHRFDRLTREANRLPIGKGAFPTDAQLLLAEVGDRLRTIARDAPSADVRAALEALGRPSPLTLSYEAYRLWIDQPLGAHRPRASEPYPMEISLGAEASSAPGF